MDMAESLVLRIYFRDKTFKDFRKVYSIRQDSTSSSYVITLLDGQSYIYEKSKIGSIILR
jgi:hypothetical protein